MLRRNFLKHCRNAGLGFAVPLGWSSLVRSQESTSHAEGYPGPYYVVFNASGGWDTTYLMDPKGVDGINRLYQEGDIQTEGQHRFAPTAKQVQKGMSNEDFFRTYGQELRVFNGLDLSVNNHTPCARYMATGKLDSLAYPTFPALVAACRGASAPLAFLTFGNYSATGNLVPMSRVPYLQSLNLLARADSVEGIDQQVEIARHVLALLRHHIVYVRVLSIIRVLHRRPPQRLALGRQRLDAVQAILRSN